MLNVFRCVSNYPALYSSKQIISTIFISHPDPRSRFGSKARHNTHYISKQTARTRCAVLQQPVGRHQIRRGWHDRGGMWLEELGAHCAASDKGGGPGRLHKCLCLYKLRFFNFLFNFFFFFGVYASQLHYIAGKLVRTLVKNQSCNFRFPLDVARIFSILNPGTTSIWCLNGAFGGISSGRAALRESAIRILPSLLQTEWLQLSQSVNWAFGKQTFLEASV